MELTTDILKHIDESILCWLATASQDGQPNVSPKEIFTYHAQHLLIANIMSPQSVENILANPKVAVSFINVLIQKGYQVKGKAQIITRDDETFDKWHSPLFKIAGKDFPIASIIKIKIESVKPIIAPRYILFPETREEDQIDMASKQYKL